MKRLFTSSQNPELPWLNPTVPSQELQAALKELKKPKLVAWIASNCDTHSDREDYVKELKKHIQVILLLWRLSFLAHFFFALFFFLSSSRWMYMESVEIKSVDLLTEDPATCSATPRSKRTTSSSLPSRTRSALTTSLRSSIGHFQGKYIHVGVLLPIVNLLLVFWLTHT